MAERLPLPMPSGWFVAALSRDLAPGAVARLRLFGRDLVAWRTAAGEARLADPYCPHLGAHLGHGGAVQGEELRCPFHGWRFGTDGACAHAPGAQKTPRAGLGLWPTVERDGTVLVWNDALGRPPAWEPPELEGSWTEDQVIRWELSTHPQEICENSVDVGHLLPVHQVRDGGLDRVEKKGPRLEIDLHFVGSGEVIGIPGVESDVRLWVRLHGLGLLVVRTEVAQHGIAARQRICVTPIDDERAIVLGLISAERSDDPGHDQSVADLMYQAFCTDFAKDFPIWENKRYVESPRLSSADGPIGPFRKWAKQFYPEGAPRAASERASGEARNGTRASGSSWAWPEPVSAVWSRVGAGVVAPARRALDVARTWLAPGTSFFADDVAGDPILAGNGPSGAATSPVPGPSLVTHPGPKPSGPRVRDVADYFATLPQRFVPEAAAGLDAVFQWTLTGDGGAVFHSIVHDGVLEVRPGAHPEPTVQLIIDAADYVRVLNGELDGTRAFTIGGGKVKGNLRLALRMRELFPM